MVSRRSRTASSVEVKDKFWTFALGSQERLVLKWPELVGKCGGAKYQRVQYQNIWVELGVGTDSSKGTDSAQIEPGHILHGIEKPYREYRQDV